MNESEVLVKLAENVQNASVRDTVLLLVVILIAVGYLAEKIIRLKSLKKETGCSEEAMAIITQKDSDGLPILLSIPRMLRDFTKVIERLDGSVRQLANHNTELLKSIYDESKTARNYAEETKEQLLRQAR